MPPRTLTCKADKCTQRVPPGSHPTRRYCSTRCRERQRSRDQRARARQKKIGVDLAAQVTKPLNRDGTSWIEENARRGPLYEKLLTSPEILQPLLAGLMTYEEAGEMLGCSKANVHRILIALRQDALTENAAATWVIAEGPRRLLGPDIADAPIETDDPEAWVRFLDTLVDCFVEWRDRYMVDEGGATYITKMFHRTWIRSILGAIYTGSRQMILSPPRHGKALDVATPMLTGRGWVDAGDVKRSDTLVGPDGEWTDVLSVHPQGVTDAWEVEFSDQARLVVSGDHLWEVATRYGGTHVLTTTQIRERGITEPDGHSRWRIPLGVYQGTTTELPVDPYLFGCWVGDGSSDQGEITSADPEILAGFDNIYERGKPRHQNCGKATRVGYLGLAPHLRRLGVLRNKHLPDLYLHADIGQRTALLQGLMDTDGSVSRSSCQVEYSTKLRPLAEQVRWLVNSLGGTAIVAERVIDGATYQRVFIQTAFAPFRLPRKIDAWVAANKRPPIRTIRAIRRVDDRETVCFRVDNPRHLFAAGTDMILTHNTQLLIDFCTWLIVRDAHIRIIWIASNSDLAEDWVQAIQDQLESNEKLRADYLAPGTDWKPAARSGKSWSRKQFKVGTRTRVVKSPTMQAVGRGGKILSRDVDFMIVDDIEDHQSTIQPGARAHTRTWFAQDVGSRKEDGTAAVVIGSRQHPDDLYGHLIDNPEWGCIVEEAHSSLCDLDPFDEAAHTSCMLFPEKRSYAWLQGQRRSFQITGGETLFLMVYQNIAMDDGLIIFDPDEMKKCRSHRGLGDIPPGVTLVAGLDPATSGYQAAVLWGYSRATGLLYMIDIANDLGAGIPGWRDTLQAWFERYEVRHWVVEENSMQSGYTADSWVQSYKAAHHIHIEGHQTQGNKWDKFVGVTAMARMFGETVELTNPTTSQREKHRMVDLPYGTPAAKARTDLYIQQATHFSGAASQNRNPRTGYHSDVVMASWFPMKAIRRLQKERSAEVELQYTPTFGQITPMFGVTSDLPWERMSG